MRVAAGADPGCVGFLGQPDSCKGIEWSYNNQSKYVKMPLDVLWGWMPVGFITQRPAQVASRPINHIPPPGPLIFLQRNAHGPGKWECVLLAQ